MPAALLGRKVGMTRLYVTRTVKDAEGNDVEQVTNDPVTILQAGPCRVSQVKTVETDGYDAIQLAFEPVKARNSTMPVIGHDAKAGLDAHRFHREIRLTADEAAGYEAGQQLDVSVFENTLFVEVTGTSKGKGFAGPMKRWRFKGLTATHGTERKHRSPGSVGSRASNAGTGKPKKGGKKAGQMGARRVTARSIEVVGTDKEKNLLLVKGAVPGANQGFVFIREANRLCKAKAKKLAEAS